MKVLFVLEPGAWHGSATETLWAAPIAPGQYRLENSPFYAFGVSYQDVVAAKEIDRNLQFQEVVRRSGHSTYRIIKAHRAEQSFDEQWAPLAAVGCTFEQGPGSLLSVDVPPAANISAVYRDLQAGETAGVWSFEEGHCGHPVA